MNDGITVSMKTAISVEDTLMNEADDAARDLGMSRSALIAEALREYLWRRRQSRISARLDEVYKDEPAAEEQQLVRKLRRKLRTPDRW